MTPRLASIAPVSALCLFLVAAVFPASSQTVAAAGAPAIARFVPVLQEAPDDEGVEQVHAKKLAGSVHMALEGSPLALVLVEECDLTFSKVLASTHTDHYGNFELKPGRRGKVHYLRLSANGFTTREYEVILAPDAPDSLKLELQLAAKTQSVPARRFTGRIFES